MGKGEGSGWFYKRERGNGGEEMRCLFASPRESTFCLYIKPAVVACILNTNYGNQVKVEYKY